jgi:hypothetical protein
MPLFIIAVALLLALLLVVRFTRYRGHRWDRHYPALAWLRAGIYFCGCYLVSYFSGAMEILLTTPIATAAQRADPRWWGFTVGVYAFILVAYPGVWAYYTVVFERPRRILTGIVFGLLWGSSSGQLFLSVWVLMDGFDWPVWGRWLATFLVLGAWQPNWHNIYWDHYIAPEHDTPLTQKIKALGCHIPNLVIGLTHLALYGNYFIFFSAQLIALLAASIAMRFPAPWDPPSGQNFAHRTRARIPRCTGYVPADPRTDPYTPFHPGWRGAGR